jgi:transposase
MAYRYGNREQIELLPTCIEDYVGQDDPVRAYDAFVDALDLKDLGIEEDPDQVGNSEYDPRTMLKLFVYGYSYGNDRSSRKLERALHHNVSFMWLMGGLKPDFKTISNFRKDNKESLGKVLKQSARMCMRLGLIDGNILFIDGTKIRANASIKNTWNEKRCEEVLKKADKRIEEILAEAERLDNQECGSGSLVQLQEELKGKQELRKKVEAIAEELKQKGRSSMNTVDTDCVSTKSIHGSYAGYNAQIAVDQKHGLIGASDVVRSTVDQGQLSQQVNNAEETMEKQCVMAVADGGYSDLEDIEEIDKATDVLVPIQRQTEKQEGFIYNKENNTYTCPEGHTLIQYIVESERKRTRYKLNDPVICRMCARFGICTKSIRGRNISRSFFEESAQRLIENYARPEKQAIYKQRAEKVELPFGHMRRTLGIRSFLLRGLIGVKAEMSLFSSAFNIRRMITLLGGVENFIAKVSA